MEGWYWGGSTVYGPVAVHLQKNELLFKKLFLYLSKLRYMVFANYRVAR